MAGSGVDSKRERRVVTPRGSPSAEGLVSSFCFQFAKLDSNAVDKYCSAWCGPTWIAGKVGCRLSFAIGCMPSLFHGPLLVWINP